MIRVLCLRSFSLSSGITQKVHLHLSTSIKFLSLLSGRQLSSEARHTPPWLGAQHLHAVVTADRYSSGLVAAPGSFLCVCRTPKHTCQWNFWKKSSVSQSVCKFNSITMLTRPYGFAQRKIFHSKIFYPEAPVCHLTNM